MSGKNKIKEKKQEMKREGKRTGRAFEVPPMGLGRVQYTKGQGFFWGGTE